MSLHDKPNTKRTPWVAILALCISVANITATIAYTKGLRDGAERERQKQSQAAPETIP